MAINGVSPKVGKILALPDQSITIGTATATTDTAATVAFTAGSETTGGPVLSYQAISTPGSITAKGNSSPITVTGLTTGTAYTFQVIAQNPSGDSTAGYSSASNSATPVSLSSYESIATVTASGSASSMTISSIPQTYSHLRVIISARTASTGPRLDAYLQFNGDTSTNYSYRWMYNSGSNGPYANSAINASQLSSTYIPGSAVTSNVFGLFIIDIPDYASTNKYKTAGILTGWNNRGTTSENNMANVVGSWRNSTTGINSITFAQSGNFVSGSTMSIYGLKG